MPKEGESGDWQAILWFLKAAGQALHRGELRVEEVFPDGRGRERHPWTDAPYGYRFVFRTVSVLLYVFPEIRVDGILLAGDLIRERVSGTYVDVHTFLKGACAERIVSQEQEDAEEEQAHRERVRAEGGVAVLVALADKLRRLTDEGA